MKECSNYEIRRHTGFSSMNTTLGFSSIICNEDMDMIRQAESRFTWFKKKHFFRYHEGRLINRWSDAEENYYARYPEKYLMRS